MKNPPEFKTELSASLLGSKFTFQVPHDLFSTQQIDEGTILLLKNLTKTPPSWVLDMGCGYGALGLPIARLFPQTQIHLVDRDLLAVKWCQINAAQLRLSNTQIYGSLGFRDLQASPEKASLKFDWILCNMPARIGEKFIENFLTEGLTHLTENGEIRTVVISDLVPILESIARTQELQLETIATGPRHSVLSLKSSPSVFKKPKTESEKISDSGLYLRDEVLFADLKWDRPFDWGGDDPKRLQYGLPILLETLPKKPPRSILCFRAGYGILPILMHRHWASAQITVIERDLLASTFLKRNIQKHLASLNSFTNSFKILESPDLLSAISSPSQSPESPHYDLIIGEISASAGQAVALSEIHALASVLHPDGHALLLMFEKQEREWIRPLQKNSPAPSIPMPPLRLQTILTRNGYSLVRLDP